MQIIIKIFLKVVQFTIKTATCCGYYNNYMFGKFSTHVSPQIVQIANSWTLRPRELLHLDFILQVTVALYSTKSTNQIASFWTAT